jgi:AraC-like DNA-binding protein
MVKPLEINLFFYKKASEQLKGKLNAHYGSSRYNIHYIPTTQCELEVKDGIDYMYFLIVLSKDYYFNLIDTTRLGMEKARKLLVNEQLPISEVSAAVGFSHQNNFSIAFKNTLDCHRASSEFRFNCYIKRAINSIFCNFLLVVLKCSI